MISTYHIYRDPGVVALTGDSSIVATCYVDPFIWITVLPDGTVTRRGTVGDAEHEDIAAGLDGWVRGEHLDPSDLPQTVAKAMGY